MTPNSPYQITLRTKQIVDKIMNNPMAIPETELVYYKKKIEAEQLRMEQLMWNTTVQSVQTEISDEIIPLLNNALDKINNVLSLCKTSNNFSSLTDRLNHINKGL